MVGGDWREGELNRLLTQVRVEGFVLTDTAYLLHLLGRQRERAETWADVRNAFAQLEGKPATLRGRRFGTKLLITSFDMAKNPFEAGEEITPHPSGAREG